MLLAFPSSCTSIGHYICKPWLSSAWSEYEYDRDGWAAQLTLAHVSVRLTTTLWHVIWRLFAMDKDFICMYVTKTSLSSKIDCCFNSRRYSGKNIFTGWHRWLFAALILCPTLCPSPRTLSGRGSISQTVFRVADSWLSQTQDRRAFPVRFHCSSLVAAGVCRGCRVQCPNWPLIRTAIVCPLVICGAVEGQQPPWTDQRLRSLSLVPPTLQC